MSDFSKYNLTPSAKQAIVDAQIYADTKGHLKVIDLHLFYCLLDQENINIDHCLDEFGISKSVLQDTLDKILDSYKEPRRKKFIFAPEIFDILDFAVKIARLSDHGGVGVDHIFLSILTTRDQIVGFLTALQIDILTMVPFFKDILRNGAIKQPTANKAKPKSSNSDGINEWCENINVNLSKRKRPEIFGRDKEISRCFEILLKKNKSNVILVGDAGVGKTAIVDGIAEKIIFRSCPELLLEKEIISLSLTNLVAGSMYRGQMEEKIKKVLSFFTNSDKYVLFIDEIHTIIGAGSSEGGLDVANILKPVLSRGDISVIGATTKEEYDRYFGKESALKRRFEKVDVKEPTKEQCARLLKNTKFSYEKFHSVKYSDKMIDLIIDLCDKYEPKKRFPDKAFDILDELGCKTKIKEFKRPKEIIEIEDKLIEAEINNKTKEPEYKKNEKKFKNLVKKWGEGLSKKVFEVDSELIYEIFAEKIGANTNSIKNLDNVRLEGEIGFGV
jgi:ATP-dependent Clp protease ATP-binding subunit ClpC|tara:strand:- start:1578 stop:3080 length:1503 start_codon:yes stop_codon:yes gene_type:complete